MAFNNGAKLAMWSFDDKGSYGVANLTYRRKDREGGFVNYGHKFCYIYDLAYIELKDVEIPEGGHVDIKIADEAYDRQVGESTFKQNPIEVDARYNTEKGRQDFNIKIFKASVVKVNEKSTKQGEVEQAPIKPAETPKNTERGGENVTPEISMPQSGLVGLDFLNIPDNSDIELPFR